MPDMAEERQDMRPGGKGGLIKPPWNSETARAAGLRSMEVRAERARRAALQGIVDAGKQIPGVVGVHPEAVIRHLAEQHTLNAADPSARNSVQSWRQVMSVAYPNIRREGDSGGDRVSDPDLADLLAAWRAAKAANPALAEAAAAALAAQELGE